MNSDKITTIVGAVIGFLVILGALTQDQASTLTKAAEILAGLLIGVWGHQTNK